MLSQLVAQHIPEIGIRRAVGAQKLDLLLLVARQGGVPVLAGLGLGIGCSLGMGRLLTSHLYGIQPADPYALAVVLLLLLAMACAAMLVPAGRAARVDPMRALRDE